MITIKSVKNFSNSYVAKKTDETIVVSIEEYSGKNCG